MILLLVSLIWVADVASLDRLREELATRGKPATMDALEQLSDPRAQLWLGDLARESGDLPRAHAAFARVVGAPGDLGRLAERGLGDVAMIRGHYAEARKHYEISRNGATPLLAVELDQKLALAQKLGLRRGFAIAAVGVVALALGWFVARIRRRGPPLGFPTELIYVVPVYALLVAGAWGRDRNLVHAMILCALSSLIVIALSAFAAMRAPAKPWLHVSVLGAANLALFYAILWRTDLLDPLLTTAVP